MTEAQQAIHSIGITTLVATVWFFYAVSHKAVDSPELKAKLYQMQQNEGPWMCTLRGKHITLRKKVIKYKYSGRHITDELGNQFSVYDCERM